jgi:hypothetical protein
MEPRKLSPMEENDVRELLAWCFMGRPGIPQTKVLRDLWSDLHGRTLAKRDAEDAAEGRSIVENDAIQAEHKEAH